MADQILEIEAYDNIKIPCFLWSPKDDRSYRGLMLVIHGMAEHGAKYKEMAKELNKEGIVVAAVELRGHGKSIDINHQQEGHFADEGGDKLVQGDIQLLIQFLKDKYPGIPTYLFGHSLGSIFALSYCVEKSENIDALILSSTYHVNPLVARFFEFAAETENRLIRRFTGHHHGKSLLVHLLTFVRFNLSFTLHGTGLEWLTSDKETIRKFKADKRLGFRCTAQLWADFFHVMYTLHEDHNLDRIRKDLPILLLGGAEDVSSTVKDIERLRTRLRRLGIHDVHARIFEDCRHEIIHEKSRGEVFAVLRSWLRDVATATENF